MDFAQRAHDHNYKMDPIVRKRSDTDLYLVTMGAAIHEKHPMTEVAFELTNRSLNVRLADMITLEEMTEQLDHVKTLKWSKSELINIRGQSYYGQENLFKSSYVNRMAISRLPDYELSVDKESGQFKFRTHGTWLDVKDWEVQLLAVTNELRSRAIMRTMSKADLQVMYARAITKLYAKLERLRERPELQVSDFGTRRRHSFLWQEWCVLAACDVLGDQFVGTSNVLLAMKHELEAKGTNAHQMPMVYAALASQNGDQAIVDSQYQVLHDWGNVFPPALHVFLPDTFGTTQFLENAPSWLQFWAGYRPDSKEPFEAGEEAIAFWKKMGSDPAKKLCLFADGLDVEIPGFKPNGVDMISIHDRFKGRIRDGYGWGTMFTNDFIGCVPGNPTALNPISIVCKPESANGHPCVKISDNPSKARSSDPAELERYLRIFGHAGVGAARETLV